MITWLSGIWQSITNFFTWIGEAIDWIVEEIIQISTWIGDAVQYVWSLIQLIPSIYILPASIILVIVILFQIVGRSQGGSE